MTPFSVVPQPALPLAELSERFGFILPSANAPLGSGLIHSTLLLGDATRETAYVLQQINTHVFRDLAAIAQNQAQAAAHLAQNAPEYYFMAALRGTDGQIFQEVDGNWWRLLPYVRESVAFEQATNADQIYEAALAFGLFARHLEGCDVGAFRPTIPEFHDLRKYNRELLHAFENASTQRIALAKNALTKLETHERIKQLAEAIQTAPQFPLRVLHHDAKMGNILFHQVTHKPLCVIDLDTIMAGKIYSDIGDLIRSSVSTAPEHPREFLHQEVNHQYLKAALEGYRETMHSVLTREEKEYLPKAGHIMLYMQAVRFLADYLRGDTYYKTEYDLHNLDRAEGQLEVLRALG
jgi:Ser/Thr protein kinase RdoA (MazF antagonist)